VPTRGRHEVRENRLVWIRSGKEGAAEHLAASTGEEEHEKLVWIAYLWGGVAVGERSPWELRKLIKKNERKRGPRRMS